MSEEVFLYMSVLVSKMVCLGRHDPHKQKLGGSSIVAGTVKES